MNEFRTRTSTRGIGAAALALLLIVPSLAQAELRVDLKIFGMD
ncbi:MAG TPA: hypothetical protein VFT47_00435 [Vicinamibacterales bacterium]|nr:hypothetical protein [Vicinamibacterales bacterium]